MRTTRTWPMLAAFYFLVAYCSSASKVEDVERVWVNFLMPNTRRTEGRITMEYVEDDHRVKHELAFSEVNDGETRRTKLSIGYVSYQPKVYWALGDTVLTLNNNNDKCERISGEHALEPKFLPEIDYFLRYSYTDAELAFNLDKVKAHFLGPVGLILMYITKPGIAAVSIVGLAEMSFET